MLGKKRLLKLQLGQENFLFGLSWVWKKLTGKKKLPNNNQNNREAELMKKKKEFYHDTLCILDTYLFS